jgi:predicted nucleic acid-binding protein
MTASARVFLDTNILVYAFDKSEPEKRETAIGIIAETTSNGTAVVSTQILQEFYVIVTRKLTPPLPAADAEQAVGRLSALPCPLIDPPLVIAAVRTSRKHRLSFWDALIIETALSGGCSVLLTEDLQDGFQLRGLTVSNPFK